MPTTATNLKRITEDIWTTVIGLVPEEASLPFSPNERVITGLVSIMGDWTGTVSVAVPEGLARLAAASMFGMDVSEVADEDVRDTVGELANMTGGNVKSALGGTAQLSLPTVTEGGDYQVTVRGSREVDRVELVCEGHPLIITTTQRD